MRKLYFLLMPAFLLCLCSCGKDNSNKPQTLITNKWTLQKEDYVNYIDGVKKYDTTLNVSNKINSNLQFDSNGSFTSATQYAFNGLSSLEPGLTGTANTNGTYSMSGTALKLSAGVSDFADMLLYYPTGISVNPGDISTNGTIVEVATVDMLTSAGFNLHLEYTLSYTNTSGAHTEKTIMELYYSR